MPRKKLYFDLMATLKELRNEGQKINKYDDALQFAKMVADDARKISSQYYKTDLKFVTKSDTSPVTIADEKINQINLDQDHKIEQTEIVQNIHILPEDIEKSNPFVQFDGIEYEIVPLSKFIAGICM